MTKAGRTTSPDYATDAGPPGFDWVVFDLDDTLCDYANAKARGLDEAARIVEEHGLDRDAFIAAYQSLEPSLWASFAASEINIEAYRQRRFSDALTASGAAAEMLALAAILNSAYMVVANPQVELFPDALPTLSQLKDAGIRIAVLTNGPSDGQNAKIDALQLRDAVDRIFVSAELGIANPARRYFNLSATRSAAILGAYFLSATTPITTLPAHSQSAHTRSSSTVKDGIASGPAGRLADFAKSSASLTVQDREAPEVV